MKIGDKVKAIEGNPITNGLEGEIYRLSKCSYFGHTMCDELLLSLTVAPDAFYHAKNFVVVTDL